MRNLYCFIKTIIFSVIINRRNFVNMFFIAGYMGQPFANHRWNSLDHWWRMVRLLRNILETIILFPICIILPVFRLNVRSRYSVICKVVSIVMFKPSSVNILRYSFLIFSNSFPARSLFPFNTRDELISKCRHMNKFTLKCFRICQSIVITLP